MNREAFAVHHRQIKARCFERTIDALVRTGKIGASEDELSDAVAGFSDETWALVTAIANATHDCGVMHDVPSSDAQTEVVNLFTDRALRSAKVSEILEREIRSRALRAVRHMQVMR